jgi:large subunit ribosomal protein L22
MKIKFVMKDNLKTILKYGFFAGLFNILLSVLFYVTDYAFLGLFALGSIPAISGVLTLALLIIFGIKYRNEFSPDFYKYKLALKNAILMVVIISLLGVIYSLTFRFVIEPEYENRMKVEVAKINIAKYLNKDVMISPRKLRLLANNIKKMSPVEALARLKFTNTKAARIMIKALQNVIADAKNNFNLESDTLKFDLVKVDEGLKMKRMDKSHGSRFARGLIQKRHSRLVIHVKGKQK